MFAAPPPAPHFSLVGVDPRFYALDPWTLPNIIGLCGGGCWVLLYVVAVCYGVRQKNYAIPAFAVPFNLGWEFLTSFVIPNPVSAWMWVNRVWLLIDCVLVAQTLYFAGRQLGAEPARQRFYWSFAFLVCFSIASQYGYVLTFRDTLGYEVAFVIDVLMSMLFIQRYYAQRDNSSLAYAIAWLKLFGNLGVSIQTWVLFPQIHPETPSFAFFHVLYATLFVLDAFYIGLLTRARFSVASASLAARS